MSAPLVPITIALLVGILCGASGFGPWPGVAVGLLGAGLAVRQAKAPRIAMIGVLLLWGSVGWLRLSLWHAHPSAALEQQLPEEPQPVRLHGVVRDDPVELFEPNEPQVRQTCVIELRHILRAGAWEPVSGRLRAMLQSPRTRVSYGDELLVEGVWHRVPAPGNPGQYDWRASLARSHIHGLFRARPADGIVIVQSHRGHPLLEAVFHLRARW
ncbi:MAG: ComEC/Rec2 family competence protein, partial [Candidatus Omnitrophota bacterium]|nr:ComEC/Rec2 family competence protein [Candidatus Omnitrophota bacterium]